MTEKISDGTDIISFSAVYRETLMGLRDPWLEWLDTQGGLNVYVDKILTFFDHLPTSL